MLATRLSLRSSRSCLLHRDVQCRRNLSQLIQVPLIFTGLLVTLWTWKSLMLIIFQNRIIYMPYLGRWEKLQDYPTPGVIWNRRVINASDGTRLVLCKSSLWSMEKKRQSLGIGRKEHVKRKIKVVYLQGNASSTPPRLPPLSKILSSASRAAQDLDLEVWTVAYRGYWESSGRPSESGLLQDVQASLDFILNNRKQDTDNESQTELIIWGHSIGASLAVLSVPHLVAKTLAGRVHPRVKFILETPFDGTSSILKELYPQRWLPYRYLSPFLQTRFDMCHALTLFTRNASKAEIQVLQEMPILIVRAEKDEIVPANMSDAVVSLLKRHEIGQVTTAIVRGGLHQDCIFKSEMHRLVIDFILCAK